MKEEKLKREISDKNLRRKLVTLIEPELSYKVMGILFKVHSNIGSSHHERYYQRACKIEFDKEGISYRKELKVPFDYCGKSIGRYFIDFVIEDKIALELKANKEVTKEEIGQLLKYLRKTNLKLGILANFGKSSLEYKRVINNEYKNS